jgi:frataxin-like iron-binding protein CyaY
LQVLAKHSLDSINAEIEEENTSDFADNIITVESNNDSDIAKTRSKVNQKLVRSKQKKGKRKGYRTKRFSKWVVGIGKQCNSMLCELLANNPVIAPVGAVKSKAQVGPAATVASEGRFGNSEENDEYVETVGKVDEQSVESEMEEEGDHIVGNGKDLHDAAEDLTNDIEKSLEDPADSEYVGDFDPQ